jgi:hypothetical protein
VCGGFRDGDSEKKMTLSSLRWGERFQGRAIFKIIPKGRLKMAVPD